MGVVTITDKTFEQEVLKSTLPVVVDFWASWCVDPEARVSGLFGEQTAAKDVQIGQEVIGLGPGAASIGRVSHSRVVSDEGHCKEVILETGRKIKVTDDHPFYTPLGWIAAEQLRKGDFLAVLPIGDPEESAEVEFREVVLARLSGILFTDGTLYHDSKNHYWEVSFSLGQAGDVAELRRDLETLGLRRVHVKEIAKKQKIGEREFTTHLFRVKCLSKELFSLLAERGVPVGAKKSQKYSVPSWIMNGQRAVKRGFLRGYLGGDGPKVDMGVTSRKGKLPCNSVRLNDLEFHKDPKLVDSGLKLASQVSELLSEFGVKVARIFAEKDIYVRVDGKRSAIIHIVFKKDFQNAYNFACNVGYAYCKQKGTRSLVVAEFIREVIYLRSKWSDVYKRVLSLASFGDGYREISKKLGISPSQTYAWIKGRAKATVAYHKMKFDSWLTERQKNAPDGFIWEKIEEVSQVFLPKVARLTVDSTNSFVANGFLSHNCGPCLVAAPIIDQLATEYEGKVKVGKLSVEENQEQPTRFNVMAIPTVILFKDGKEVARQVGFAGKEGYEKLIKLALGASA